MIKNIVLIHGWACDESIWQETENYLEQKYCLYTINLLLMKNTYSYRDAVIELIEQKGLTKVVLVGWSMGSIVAIQVASYLLQKVQGMVLVSGTSKFIAEMPTQVLGSGDSLEDTDFKNNELYQEGIPSVLVTKMKKRLSKNLERTLKDFYKLMFSSKEQAQGLDDKITDNNLSCGRRWELLEALSGLDFLMEADVREDLQNITCPTLLLHGEADNLCPLEGAKSIERQLPCAQLVSYPGVGHIPFLTEFRNFHLDLEEWLAVL
ncbi:alpha/beta fold hydrolase [Desulfosporosinus fructosivorans]|uniref:Alpha/beta fold hydrolase n=1 Tax=Desulfosporosinus fructosivorans TaxID=2018669 RepID=A0A4Z0R2S0_9FIRM|nr:alpha/beta fold hydrolase [Desulfosporosinus fructosivorans]TGE37351.1 alpha/beta fold hydrolase [Desulfosporosinus fructosivorans]